ncbi:hypothetical protein Y032_0336g2894 [Ancylostoma ceylanicum]|uniref:Uncharacterized protein n=1 Tax=Ancylostoma ceylanicum TaxID=53326 RepID=A0A016RZL4_9BILA|nr:hypothetical protein Y032_0336g2894 [Ancylostoma ceylanicum]
MLLGCPKNPGITEGVLEYCSPRSIATRVFSSVFSTKLAHFIDRQRHRHANTKNQRIYRFGSIVLDDYWLFGIENRVLRLPWPEKIGETLLDPSFYTPGQGFCFGECQHLAFCKRSFYL